MKTPGLYLPVLLLSFVLSCTDEPTEEPPDLPVASFTSSTDFVIEQDEVYFTSKCKNADNFSWVFGDGAVSSEPHPVHVYSESGTYSVSLTASNSSGSDEHSAEITVLESSPGWSKGADMFSNRNAHVVAVHGNKIYVASGYIGSINIEIYDPASGTWTQGAALSGLKDFAGGCALGGKIYVMGGWWEEVTYDLVEVYDPASDSWTTKAPMPLPSWGHLAIPVNGKIYVLGGADDFPVSKFYTSIQVYDPASDSWSTLPEEGVTDFLSGWAMSACKLEGKIYIMGGNTATDYMRQGNFVLAHNRNQVYDIESNTWTNKAPMPTARYGAGVATVNGKIYAIGGTDMYTPQWLLNVVEEYDPVTDTWTRKSPMPHGRIPYAACSIDDLIYLPGGGGYLAEDAFKDLFIYDPSRDPSSR